MSTLRTLKKLLFGETWILPLGIAAVLCVTALLHGGRGVVLLAGVVLVLGASVIRSARRR